MTGEITLRGRVLPIGGLKEKALAAKRMGIKTVVVPKRNKKDVDDLPKYVKDGMNFVLVATADESLRTTLVEPKKAVLSNSKLKKIVHARSGNSEGPVKRKATTTRNATLSNRRVKASQRSKRKV